MSRSTLRVSSAVSSDPTIGRFQVWCRFETKRSRLKGDRMSQLRKHMTNVLGRRPQDPCLSTDKLRSHLKGFLVTVREYLFS